MVADRNKASLRKAVLNPTTRWRTGIDRDWQEVNAIVFLVTSHEKQEKRDRGLRHQL